MISLAYLLIAGAGFLWSLYKAESGYQTGITWLIWGAFNAIYFSL